MFLIFTFVCLAVSCVVWAGLELLVELGEARDFCSSAGLQRGPSVPLRREMCALCPWWSLDRWDTSSAQEHSLCTQPDGRREWTRWTPLGPYTLYTFSPPGASATVLPSVELWRGEISYLKQSLTSDPPTYGLQALVTQHMMPCEEREKHFQWRARKYQWWFV